MEEKKLELELFLGLRSPVGKLSARRRVAAITGSKFRIESYPLLASSQHVGATAAVTIIDWIVFGWIVCIILAELSEIQIGRIVCGRIVWTRSSLVFVKWKPYLLLGYIYNSFCRIRDILNMFSLDKK